MNILPILYAVGVLGGLGLLFGAVLAVVGKKFAVKVDERVVQVREQLGGANCGACGYAGCDAFAEAVVKGETKLNGCTPGGAKAAKAIAQIMGTTAEEIEPMVARVRCNGTCENVSQRYEYNGLPSCRAASAISGGPTQCEFGCLGLGDCVSRCPFSAITLADGIAHIDESKCTGCGVCMNICPRGIINLLPRDKTVVVLCRNKATGKIARLQCKTACVGCHRCEKQCPSDAIHVVDGVAEIDDGKCTRCGACVQGCPMHCIHNLFVPEEEREGMELEE
ncbi:MAG: Fe-S cluster domain-containing protein [Clostridia bacterium]